MMISKLNAGMSNVGFGGTQVKSTVTRKSENEKPDFIYGADKLPEGYHWEHDIDHDQFVAVKNGMKFNEDKFIAEPVVPYTPIIRKEAPVAEKTVDDTFRYADDIRHPAPGYHIEHDLDADIYFEVKNGYKMTESGPFATEKVN